MDDLKQEPPEAVIGDAAHTLGRSLLSMIPVVGGPAVELFAMIITPPLAKRRDEWISSIVRGLQELEQQVDGFTIEALAQSEEFITAVMQASRAAMSTHHKEKLEALRNAVLNSALPLSTLEDMQTMFIDYIDTLTPWHIQILKFVDDPHGWLRERDIEVEDDPNMEFENLLTKAFPDFEKEIKADRANGNIIDVISTDLWSRRLIRVDYLLNLKGVPRYCTTDIGRNFLAYITSPIDSGSEQS